MRVLAVLLLLAAAQLSAVADYPAPGPVGLAAMEHFELMPYLWDGAKYGFASSYDRTLANVDRNNFLYSSGGQRVLLDVNGPGCIYRLWITSLATTTFNLRIYFDNDATPRVNTLWSNLFNNTTPPFTSPFTGYTAGGYYCYLPLQFKQHCRITVDNPGTEWFYYNINYVTYTDPNAVTTYTGSEDTTAARGVWNSTGNPNTTPDSETISGSASLAPGTSVTITDRAGPAQVKSIAIQIPRIVPNDTISESLLNDIRIRAYWDNETTPSVDAPIGEFFATGLGESAVNSLPIDVGIATGDWYRSYFPMPFGSHARIEIYNGSGYYAVNAVSWEVKLASMPNATSLLAAGDIGCFHASASREFPTTAGKDYLILHTAGRGAFVGCVVSMVGSDDEYQFLEGDERIHIDGALTPSIHGTGTEDFFNCGWYYKYGPITSQSHGVPAKLSSPTCRISTYRLFMHDRVPYYGSIRVGLEHGNVNDTDGDYSSVAFYYEVPNSELVLTDEIDIGSDSSEIAHGRQFSGQTWNGSLGMAYESDDPAVINDDGRRINGEFSFDARIDPANHGVKLRKRMDYSVQNQSAQVYVDDTLAGTWYEAGSNTFWRDSDFEIPPALTAGKSTIRVRLVSSSLNDFRYRVYSYVSQDNAAPHPVTGLSALATPYQVRLDWSNPLDPDLEGVLIRYRTDRFPTSPTDGAVFHDRPEWPETARTLSHTGLTNGTTYYYSIYAYDGARRYSQVAHVSATPSLTTCSTAEMLPDGTGTTLENKIVSGIFSADSCIYVQEPDRTSGIRVAHSGTGLAVGDRVNVSGTMSTRTIGGVPSERMMTAVTLTRRSAGEPPKPVAMRCPDVGGAAVPPNMPGISGGVGVNNMGQLVRVVGKITAIVTSYVYLDDGSGIHDPSGRIGIAVRCPSTSIPYQIGDIIAATGIVEGSIPSGATANRRAIRTRDWSDIANYGPIE